MNQQTRYPVDMGTPHVSHLNWPSNDERWSPLAKQLASAFEPGESFPPVEVHRVVRERLKWPRTRVIALLPAAEMLGFVRYYRRPDEAIGVWCRVVS